MSEDDASLQFFDPNHPLARIGKPVVFSLLILALVVVYYLGRYAKGAEVLATLVRIAPLLILAMLAVNSAYFVFQGGLLMNVYRTVGFRRTLPYLTAMYLGMNLVNTIAPVAGLSGSIYMMHFEKKRGLSQSDTLLINYLYYLTDYTIFLVVLLVGLLYLLVVGTVTKTVLLTSLVFALFTLAVGIVGVTIFTHPSALHRTITFFNHWISRLFLRKRPVIHEEVILRFSEEAKQSWQRSRSSWHYIGYGALNSFGLHLSCLLLLWLAFRAFQVPITLQVLVAGYTVATLLNIVSPTPGGIGIAEGGMTAVFAALGVQVEQALLVSLLYRTVFIWYPLSLGIAALHILPKLAASQPE